MVDLSGIQGVNGQKYAGDIPILVRTQCRGDSVHITFSFRDDAWGLTH